MPKKTSVRKRVRPNDEMARQRAPKKRSRGYSEKERYERRIAKPKPRYADRENRDRLTENFRQAEDSRYPRNRRPTQKRRLKDDFDRREQQVLTRTPARLAFSFFSNLVFYGVTIGIILMSVMFSFSSKSTASIFGYQFYTVLTNSMVPQEDGPKGGFYAGDIVIVKLMDGDKVKKNDIVTFSVGDGSRYLTHRMVERKDELNGEKGAFLITKGDANKSNDPPITADRVLGKVVIAVPKVGSLIEFAREEFWACLVCILSLYGFFLVLKAYLFSSKDEPVRRKNKNRPAYSR